MPKIARLGLPFWLAGSQTTPQHLREGRQAGATGIQVSTCFAFCAESGFLGVKQQVLADIAAGTPTVAATGGLADRLPFRVVDVPATLSHPSVRARRQAVCDLGVLRSAYPCLSG